MRDAMDLVSSEMATIADSSWGISHLRDIIVQAAIMGRLGTQRPEDKSAVDLAALGERLAREGMTRQRPSEDFLPRPGWMLPASWTWSCPFDLGIVSPRNDISDSAEVGFVPMALVPTDYREPVRSQPRKWGEIKKGYTHFADGDIAVARITPCFQNGKSCVMNGLPGKAGAGSTEYHVLRPFAACVVPQYLLLFFKTPYFISGGVSRMTGTAGQQRVPGEYFAFVPVPLPPLAEQKRIVAKVDQLMALCDELEAQQAKKLLIGDQLTLSTLAALASANSEEDLATAWNRTSEHFHVLLARDKGLREARIAVVDLASRGYLSRRRPDDLPVSVVLEGRAEERRQGWIAAEENRLRRLGKLPRNERWKSTYRPPLFEIPAGLPTLPAGWHYVPIGLLGADLFNPVQTGPFGAQLHASEFVSSGVPVIAVGNVTPKGLVTEDIQYISPAKAKHLARYDVQAGDLLFARSGATLGKVCVAPASVQDWRMTGHILRVRLDGRLILPELAAYWISSSNAVLRQVTSSIRGGTRPGYNTTLLEAIVLPIPPLGDQKRIVAKVDHLMSLLDDLEAKLRKQEETATRLAESLAAAVAA